MQKFSRGSGPAETRPTFAVYCSDIPGLFHRTCWPQRYRLFPSLAIANKDVIYPSTLPMVPTALTIFLIFCRSVRNSCMLPSRSPSRSATSEKLSPFYVPASGVPGAERCRPCPVTLAPTLGCSASRSQPLDLLKFATWKYSTRICLHEGKKGPYFVGHVWL